MVRRDQAHQQTPGTAEAERELPVQGVFGRDVFIATMKTLLTAGKTDPAGLTLAAARAAFGGREGSSLKALLDQQLDQPTDIDLMAGLPVQEAGQWTAALRNLGSMEVVVDVAAVTSSGQRVMTQATAIAVRPHWAPAKAAATTDRMPLAVAAAIASQSRRTARARA